MHLFSLLTRSVPFLCVLAAAGIVPANAASPMISDFSSPPSGSSAPVSRQPFGEINGQPVELLVLTNGTGMTVKIISYGARVAALRTADRNGHWDDIVLGYDTLAGYATPTDPYFGAIVGRVGNRIAKGRFTLDGKTYQLATNDGPNHLHGGKVGFDRVVWQEDRQAHLHGAAVRLVYTSPAGEEGYPGTLHAAVTYRLTDSNEVQIDYQVTADAPTPVNLTNHSYFNLDGAGEGTILGQELELHSKAYTPVDATLIPTGELKAVAGTPMDFTSATPIGQRIQAVGGNPVGYDHNFAVEGTAGTLRWAARVYSPKTGRRLEVLTTEPGVQFYSGNFLDGTIQGKGGRTYPQYAAFCLETQHFPDAVNQPNFPNTVLRPGVTYRSTTVWRLSADRR